MAVFFFILKLFGWLLLAVLLLFLLVLLLPLGLRFEYHPDVIQLTAYFGPLHFTLWPRKEDVEAPPQKAAASADETSKLSTDKVSVDSSVVESTPAAPPTQESVPHKTSDNNVSPETPKSVPAPEQPSRTSGGLPFGISEHIHAARQLLSDDPMAFFQCMLGHTGWLGRRFLHAVHVNHLDIFWTVTACDASTTAELYGAEMTLANNLLAFVQQHVHLQSDRLWLEPDFTGQRAGERTCSFRLTSCAAVLLWLVLRLLYRLWKDPQLQPAAAKL